MTTLVANQIGSARTTHQTLNSTNEVVRGWGYLVKYYSGKHPETGKKYKAICFSLLHENQVGNKKILKDVIKNKKLALVSARNDSIVKLEVNSKWYDDIGKKGVTEIILITSGEYTLMKTNIDLGFLSNPEYSLLEESQKKNIK